MHLDDDYRLVDGAPDNWIGLICDENGDEALAMQPLLNRYGLSYIRFVAEIIVDLRNRMVSQGSTPGGARTVEPPTRHVCPKGETGNEIQGCGGTNTSDPDDEGLVDCYDCGIWFDPKREVSNAS